MKVNYIYLLFLIISLFCGKVLTQEETQPLVIQTAARSYDQPTLDEYQKCFQSNFICKQACVHESAANRTACEAECPICPILINQRVLVQGFNDSSYQPPVAMGINTTNVIRVTNEIHNILQQKLPNITTETEKNVHFMPNKNKIPSPAHIAQNLTETNGAFGMGSNANGSCCIVVRPSKNCEMNHLKSTLECHTKRRLVCGDKCTARIMYAKSVLNCKIEEDGNESCSRHMEYLPFEERQYEQPKSDNQDPKCYFVPNWPYVSCVKERPSASICRRCLQIPYGYVLIKGLPPMCIYCLSESTFFAGRNEFDLFTLRNDDMEDDQQVPAFEKYFNENDLSHMFDDINFNFEKHQRFQQNPRKRRQNRN